MPMLMERREAAPFAANTSPWPPVQNRKQGIRQRPQQESQPDGNNFNNSLHSLWIDTAEYQQYIELRRQDGDDAV